MGKDDHQPNRREDGHCSIDKRSCERQDPCSGCPVNNRDVDVSRKCIFDKKEDKRHRMDCPHTEKEVQISNYQVCFPCSIFYLATIIEKMARRGPQ